MYMRIDKACVLPDWWSGLISKSIQCKSDSGIQPLQRSCHAHEALKCHTPQMGMAVHLAVLTTQCCHPATMHAHAANCNCTRP